MIPTFVMLAILATGGDQPASGLPELCTVPGPYTKPVAGTLCSDGETGGLGRTHTKWRLGCSRGV